MSGQVPEKTFEYQHSSINSYLIVGNGKLARHLAHYFSLLNISFQTWNRTDDHQESFEKLARESQWTLLAVSDRSISEFAARTLATGSQPINFSGSLVLENCPSLHPLMTFSDELYELEFYQSVLFTGERSKGFFQQVFLELKNPYAQVDAEQRTFYHALCVMSGNFTTLLWKKYFEDMQSKMGISADVLKPYLQATMNNLLKNQDISLTGPLARGDQETIRAHQQVLKNDPYLDVYQGFVQTYQQLSPQKPLNLKKETDGIQNTIGAPDATQ